jgi:hypothetical protein
VWNVCFLATWAQIPYASLGGVVRDMDKGAM